MFNIGPGELVAILAVALIVLGPNRLPDAVRTVGRVVGELRRISSGFQDELRNAFDDSDVIDQLEKGPSGKPIPSTDAKSTSEAIDTAGTGLSGVTASTEPVDGSEHTHEDLDDLDGDGTDDTDDMDHSDDLGPADRAQDAGEPNAEDPPETDQRAAS